MANFGQASYSGLDSMSLQDRHMGMCFDQKVGNMAGMKTGQVRSLFRLDQMITSSRSLWDNVLLNAIKAHSEMWNVSRLIRNSVMLIVFVTQHTKNS